MDFAILSQYLVGKKIKIHSIILKTSLTEIDNASLNPNSSPELLLF